MSDDDHWNPLVPELTVKDLEASLGFHCAAGFAPLRALKDSWYAASETTEEGQREFLFQDPDGFLMRFAQPLGTRPAAR